MKVLIAIDSMKGSLSSLQAGEAAREGIARVYPDAQIRVFPLADGGEGTTEALTQGFGGQMVRLTVTGPQGARWRRNTASWVPGRCWKWLPPRG